MAPTITPIEGYLEENYLEDEYGGGAWQYGYGMQVNQFTGSTKETGMQILQQLFDVAIPTGMQIVQVILQDLAYGMQISQTIDQDFAPGMQVQEVIADNVNLGMQTEQEIMDQTAPVGMQVKQIDDVNNKSGMQIDQQITGQWQGIGMEVKHDTLRHAIVGEYLVENYLEDSYLAYRMEAFLGMQVKQKIRTQTPNGMQIERVIEQDKKTGMQALQIIHQETPTGMQVDHVKVNRSGMQITQVIYNIKALRFMAEFPSRGTSALGGNNWTASNQASGDFLPANLNTDVEEEVFRSSSTSVTLTSDTGITQGVPIDTIAIRNHNLTRGAVVQVQGSNNNFATIRTSFDMTVETNHMYYIAPQFPNQLQQNRYWRFIIQDTSNPDGYIQIGCILYGVSDIFSMASSFQNPLVQGFVHFKDVLPTEGFTNVMNDRALKKTLALNFRTLDVSTGNFKLVDDLVQFIRTDLKVLVIPTPAHAKRYALFGKLKQMPQYSTVDNSDDSDLSKAEVVYVDFGLEFDESL